jgi:hypothetical protein
MFSECANEVAASIEMTWCWAKMELWRLGRKEKFGLWWPYRIVSPAWPYSFAAMKSTIFDSDCICRMILPTSSFGSLVSESWMR